MEYLAAKEYLQKISKYGSILGLKNITVLLEKLGNPQDKLKFVHFAGTNGKGSTMAYVESVMMEAGYRVGKYTSPAVFEYREIIKVNGTYISEGDYGKLMRKIKSAIDTMVREGMAHPTAFEVETAIAFLFFVDKNCDIVLLETGMGGKTDATNVIKDTLCSVITAIGLDHTQFLGETLEEISRVKAGIIKNNSVIVKSLQEDVVMKQIEQVACEKSAKYIVSNYPSNVRLDKDKRIVFDYISNNIEYKDVRISMLGKYQAFNAATAIEVLIVLEKLGFVGIQDSIREGLKNAMNPGRFEVVSKQPLIVIDGAHNPQGAQALKETLQMYFTNKRIAFIMGVLSDKDYVTVAKKVLPLGDYVITVTPNNPRALNGDALAEVAKEFCSNVQSAKNVYEAVDSAIAVANDNKADVIVAFGTLSFLKDIKTYVKADCR